ncbi:aminoglycoside phosphotransferase family protein [Streptomyces triticirhizae]|uniref:Aminoglycoside phosphotransferase family protein n=1 Tax=Streptomyces triticirhizae TaxID=2483353 RepID=A0A3M2L5H2_9ACTN|nr:aminoglycoside phosphotransferase family protein [Streptomyces triticirhizae]RMI31115.1 aminoglycoside phosphotransferase family protein [Streptomyces triticirhizae]
MSQPLSEHLLRGHHRDWQVLPAEDHLPISGRIKAGRSRPGVTRFDPRCFLDEEDVLIELALLGMERIAPVYRLGPDGTRVHGFIEGEPLSALRPPGTPLSGTELDQLARLFGELAAIPPAALALVHSCPVPGRPRTSREFARGLVRFTRRRVYARHRAALGGLFQTLGIDPDVLSVTGPLVREAARMTNRPFCLLHGDLHRDNLIVAESDGQLWTIDWELAMIGDPLYDLATHLHLMNYPERQEQAMVVRWAGAVEERLPGAAEGLPRDLPRYLAYKRVQSVFTDVIRQAIAVREAPVGQLGERLTTAGQMVSRALKRAERPLGLGRAPSPSVVEGVYAAFHAGAVPAPAAPSFNGSGSTPVVGPAVRPVPPPAPGTTRRAGRGAAARRERSGSG